MFNYIITFYQKIISPLLSCFTGTTHSCRFAPTCSEYARLAIAKHGYIIGTLKAIWRILRCNPLTKPRIDHP